MISTLKAWVSRRSRARRAEIFFALIDPDPDAYVVDLGGGKGRHMATHYALLRHVCIADFNPDALSFAAERFGYSTLLMDGNDRLPWGDGKIDVMFCSSVIEHVTGPKASAIARFKTDGRNFGDRAWDAQTRFAAEIRRCSKAYFVQTPNRRFPVEAHSWLPLLGLLPTHWQWRVLKITNRFWPRKDERPDWHLLDYQQMCMLFPDAEIHVERFMGMAKSFIAIKRPALASASVAPDVLAAVAAE